MRSKKSKLLLKTRIIMIGTMMMTRRQTGRSSLCFAGFCWDQVTSAGSRTDPSMIHSIMHSLIHSTIHSATSCINYILHQVHIITYLYLVQFPNKVFFTSPSTCVNSPNYKVAVSQEWVMQMIRCTNITILSNILLAMDKLFWDNANMTK